MFVDHSNEDSISVKHYEYKGRKFILKRQDPYGFWTISLPKGATPKSLSGQYTSSLNTENAVRAYVNAGLTVEEAEVVNA